MSNPVSDPLSNPVSNPLPNPTEPEITVEPFPPEPRRSRRLGRVSLAPRDLALIALFAALMAALGLPGSFTLFGAAVPITAQSLGAMLAGSILGARRGFLAMLAFLALVAAGLPLLAGGRGGIGVFAGPSGGYLFGYLLGATVVGLLATKMRSRGNLPWLIVANAIGGIGAVYLIGIPFTAWRIDSGLLAVITSAVQYLPGDIIKVLISASITAAVYRSYPIPSAGYIDPRPAESDKS